MANEPVLFAVDDDREVLRAVERDLRRKYRRGRDGNGYRTLSADSAEVTMETLERVTNRGYRLGARLWTAASEIL